MNIVLSIFEREQIVFGISNASEPPTSSYDTKEIKFPLERFI